MSDQVALTPEEQRRIMPLFKQYDLDSSSIVLGDKIRPLLEKSGLSPQTLGQIWQIVDEENRGFLEFSSFAKCLRLIAHAQNGQPISPRLANVPSAMPNFNNPVLTSPMTTGSRLTSPKLPHQPMASLGTGASIMSGNGETSIPPLTSENKKRFGLLYDKSVTPPAAFIDGEVARDIFIKGKLPPEVLGQIWALVDVEHRGELTKNEFVLAMHLIQCLMDRSMPNLPSQLPAVWQPWLGTQRAPSALVANASGQQQPSLQPMAVNGTGSTPVSPQAGLAALNIANNNLAKYGISKEDKTRYDSIFDDLDPKKTGIIGPSEAVPVLMRSKLPEDVLAMIWDLADTKKRGQLDKDDFALAMHYLRRKMNGKSLPTSAEAQAKQAAIVSPNATGASAAPVPPPVQARSQIPQSTSSSLSDLVSLDQAVFKPLEPAKQPTSPTSPAENTRAKIEPTLTEKRFVPTSAFGQQLMQNSTGRQRTESVPTGTLPSIPEPVNKSVAAAAPAPANAVGAVSSATNTAAAVATGAVATAVGAVGAVGAASAFGSLGSNQPQVDLSQHNREIATLQGKVTESKTEMTQMSNDLAAVLKQKSELEAQVSELRKTYDSNTKEVHDTQQAVKQARADIAELEKDLALRTSGLDAIKQQFASEQTELTNLQNRDSEIIDQCANIQSETDQLRIDIDKIKTESEGHRTSITEHETKLQDLLVEVELLKKQRSEAESEVMRHREYLEQAKQARESHEKLVEEEKAALLAAQTSRESAAAEVQKVQEEQEQFKTLGQNVQVVEHNKQIQSVISESGVAVQEDALTTTATIPSAVPSTLPSEISVGPSSPHDLQTPPLSESNYNAVESSLKFVLPMEGRASPTLSVVNNPPQSVRSDFDAASEHQSVEHTDIDDIIDRDSFVDAPERPEEFHYSDSSDDVEGPDDVIPRKYGSTQDFNEQEEVPSASPNPAASSEAVNTEEVVADAVPSNIPSSETNSVQPSPVDVVSRSPFAIAHSEASTTMNLAASDAIDSMLSSAPTEPPSYEEAIPPSSAAASAFSASPSVVDVDSHRPALASGFTGEESLHSTTHDTIAQGINAPATASATILTGSIQPASTSSIPASSYTAPVSAPAVAPVEVPAAPSSESVTGFAQQAAPVAYGHSLTQSVSAAADFDDFDDFNNLEEAQDGDNLDAENSIFTSAQPVTQEAPVDDWQKILGPSSNNSQFAGSVAPSQQAPLQAPAASTQPASVSNDVAALTGMGFSPEQAEAALKMHNNNLFEATNYLIESMNS